MEEGSMQCEERCYGQCTRSLKLPTHIIKENPVCTCQDGYLSNDMICLIIYKLRQKSVFMCNRVIY